MRSILNTSIMLVVTLLFISCGSSNKADDNPPVNATDFNLTSNKKFNLKIDWVIGPEAGESNEIKLTFLTKIYIE